MEFFSTESYESKLEAIYERFPSVQKVPFGDAYKPGLEGMTRFVLLLGDPHLKYRTIHVAGTNGKGSVANMLASALSASGLKVGLYTSPHLVDFRERARVLEPVPEPAEGSSIMVSREYVYDFLCRYEKDMDEMDLSFFEITTGLAFKWFADEEVDVAVIEAGLGGRLDSTNIVTPDLSVITSIALDHCAMLGNTLEAIAGEKAGIFKAGVPALVGEYLPETRPVFEEKALSVGCPLIFAQDEEPSMADLVPGILEEMDLKGKYQAMNLRTVMSAVDILIANPFYSGLEDRGKVADAIVHTASRAGFHGRWELLRKDPPVIADLGHNPAALKENFSQLSEMMAEGDYSSLIIVYAIMADKDLEGILPLMPDDAVYVLTSPASSRALPAKDLVRRFKAYRESAGKPCRVVEAATVEEAIKAALSLDKDGKPLIFIGGSTYLLSEAAKVEGLQGF